LKQRKKEEDWARKRRWWRGQMLVSLCLACCPLDLHEGENENQKQKLIDHGNCLKKEGEIYLFVNY